ncbi:MAG: hypothetical protein EON47_03280, partial [Acetobacteraceae bacterium]
MPPLMCGHLAPQAAIAGNFLGNPDHMLGLDEVQRDRRRPGADSATSAAIARLDLALPFDSGRRQAQMVQGGAAGLTGFPMQGIDVELVAQHRLGIHHREADPGGSG